MQSLRCLGERKLASGFTEERSGLEIQMWHPWIIEVIKTTSMAKTDPESGQPAVKREMRRGLAVRPSNIYGNG